MPSENLPARFLATAVRPDHLEHVVDPRRGNVVGRARNQQVVVRAPARVDGLGLEEGTDLAERQREVPVGPAVDRGGSRRRAHRDP